MVPTSQRFVPGSKLEQEMWTREAEGASTTARFSKERASRGIEEGNEGDGSLEKLKERLRRERERVAENRRAASTASDVRSVLAYERADARGYVHGKEEERKDSYVRNEFRTNLANRETPSQYAAPSKGSSEILSDGSELSRAQRGIEPAESSHGNERKGKAGEQRERRSRIDAVDVSRDGRFGDGNAFLVESEDTSLNEKSENSRRLLGRNGSGIVVDSKGDSNLPITSQALQDGRGNGKEQRAHHALPPSEVKLSEMLAARVKELEKRCKKLQEEKEKYQSGLQKLKAQILKREELDESSMEADRERVRTLSEKVDELLSQEEILAERNQKLEEENRIMKQKLENLESCQEQLGLDSQSLSEVLSLKQQELSNLQAALGQMAAENELYQEQGTVLLAVKRELVDKKVALEQALADVALARSEADAARALSIQNEQLSKRAVQEAQVVREDSLRARFKMEETIRQLERQLGETSSMVEKRIVAQLLLKYIQKKGNREVLEVMAKMLDFTDEELCSVGLIANNGKGLIQGPGVETGPPESLSKMWLKFLEEEVKGQT